MVEEYKLREVWIPSDQEIEEEGHDPKGFGKSNIYLSEDFLNDATEQDNEKALILIQGTGQVRAG